MSNVEDNSKEEDTEKGENKKSPPISTHDDDKKPSVSHVSSIDDETLSPFSNEMYAIDRQYAIVLAQLVSINDREKVHKWIERLDTMNDCEEKREEREMYLKFLTLSLKNGKLVPPFNKMPPPGLRPLSQVIPKSVNNLIYKNKYVSGVCPPKEPFCERKYTAPDEIEPCLFLSRQPVPRNGGIVYAAAFSNVK